MAQDLKSLRKQLDDALEQRWKGRNGYGQIMCGPQDIEIIEEGIASGADIISSDEDYIKYEVKESAAQSVLAREAKKIAPTLTEVNCDELKSFLSGCRFQFQSAERNQRKFEHSRRVRDDLLNLAARAYDLALAMLELGEGTKEILSRNRYPVTKTDINGVPIPGTVNIREWQELKEYGDLFNKPTIENSVDLSIKLPSSLLEDAEAFQFPWVIPYDPDASEHDDGMHDYEWSLGGPWIVRLRALAELAATNAKHLERVTGKGGRKSLGSRLNGSPEDWLAQACREFAEAHGCKSQAVVLKMVQAVMEAERGKEAMKKVDGKPSKDIGRKAVRKVAQTKPKAGTV